MAQQSSICLQCRSLRRLRFSPWVGKIPWRRKWLPTPEFLPEKSHGQRSLVGYSPCGCKRVRHNLVTKPSKGNTQDSSWGDPGFSLLLKHFCFFCLLTFPGLAPIPAPGMSFLSVHLLTTIHLTRSLGSNSQEQGSDWLSIRSGVHAWSSQLR